MPKKRITLTLHDVTEELPTRSTNVLLISTLSDGTPYSVGDTSYSKKHQCFCCNDGTEPETVKKRRETFSDARYWAYMDEVKKKIGKGAPC